MKYFNFLITLCLCFVISLNLNAQGLKSFKLPNGLTVYIWEDATTPEVFGMVAVNAGSKEDPEEYTGLAHYLEHMMFKGTEKIGTLDWEKEKPIYEQIIAKYDEFAATEDPVKKEAITKEINQLTMEAAKYNYSSEFSALSDIIGGYAVNAGTNYDYTVYFNFFPPGEIYKWLQLNSERLINPVFRSFQPELETVYEEYNRVQDEQMRRIGNFLLETIYGGTPYERPIIGLPEHLKSPQLSQLNAFYNKWYVPSNMALILSGNVKTKELIPLIQETFGRLENKPLPEKKKYTVNPVKGRKEVSAKISRYPTLYLSFPGVTSSSDDKIALEICLNILSNSNRTGLVDKLALDGDLMQGGAFLRDLLVAGDVRLYAIPYYDANQRRFESLKSVEKMLLNEVKNLKEGKFDENLLWSIKREKIRQYDLQMESIYEVANQIAERFVAGKDMAELLNYKEIVENVTIDDVKSVAAKYFGSDYYAILLNEGKPSKAKELEKPNIEPIVPVRGAVSQYAQEFRLLPVKYTKPAFGDLKNVEVRKINDLSKLYYVKNPENDIFTLTLKYGIGTGKMPKLELAVPLMNNAGIMGQMEAQEVKKEFSNLGAIASYSVDDSYLTVRLTGFEQNLEASANLLMRQILLPKLDEKQLGNVVGSLYQSRKIEKTMTDYLNTALMEYVVYQDKSSFIDRLPLSEIMDLTVSNLTGEFQRATDYEAEIHYVGSLPADEVVEILKSNLPLKEGEKKSTSPEVKELSRYAENSIYFLPNNDAQQSVIWFYIEGVEYNKEMDPYIKAFNKYFSDGFTALVMQEIREYRSMAYAAEGVYQVPNSLGEKCAFLGYVGTQADKVLDAVDIYMGLLNNMPGYADRMGNIKAYLKATASVEKPHFRNESQRYQAWKLRGYEEKSPAETNLSIYEDMTFDDLLNFYNTHIKGKTIAIGICGNPKNIDLKALEKYGKVIRLNTSQVFSDK